MIDGNDYDVAEDARYMQRIFFFFCRALTFPFVEGGDPLPRRSCESSEEFAARKEEIIEKQQK